MQILIPYKNIPFKIVLFFIFFLAGTSAVRGQEQQPQAEPSAEDTTIQADSEKTIEDVPDQVIQPDNEMILYVEDKGDLNAFKYHLAIDGNLTTGNINRELLAIRTGFEMDLHKAFRLSTAPAFIYGRQNKVLNERELMVDLRGSFWYRRRLFPMAFSSFEKSNLRKIIGRHITAAGFSYKLIQLPKALFTITNLLLYESTDYVPNDRFTDRRLWRNSTKLQGEYKFTSDRFVVSHILYIQPALTQNNIRWNGNATFRYMLTKKVSLRMVLDDSYESLVVPGRKKNDFRLLFGLGVDGVK